MSGTLKPVTTKICDSGGNARVLYATTEMQGWRIDMQDAHKVVLNLQEENDESPSFFAVYDGHCGDIAAKLTADLLHKRLISDESYKDKQYEIALKRAFLGTDDDLRARPDSSQEMKHCGTTALVALVTSDGKLNVANAGDARAVISDKGVAEALSIDHRPSNEVEKARIYGAGGFIVDGRVDADHVKVRMAPSRALGDFDFKKNDNLSPENQMITAYPDVLTRQISETDEFLVLACDGIWDCMPSQDVVNFVRWGVYEGMELSEIGRLLCDKCLATSSYAQYSNGIGADNMTVIIIAILNGRTKEEWYSWIRRLEEVRED